jgi:hypothetical protein
MWVVGFVKQCDQQGLASVPVRILREFLQAKILPDLAADCFIGI